MGLRIKNAEAVSKIRRLARLRRKDTTEVVDEAVSRELQRLELIATTRLTVAMAAIRQIQRECAAGGLAAARSAEEIIGYNDRGHVD